MAKKFVLRILVLALVFGAFVAGCSTDGGVWTPVTKIDQVTGTWKLTNFDSDDFGRYFISSEEVEEITMVVDSTNTTTTSKTTTTYYGNHGFYGDKGFDVIVNQNYNNDDPPRTWWETRRFNAVRSVDVTITDWNKTDASVGTDPNISTVKVDNANHVITLTEKTQVPTNIATFAGALISADGKTLVLGGKVYVK